jgi:hypothetical protein
MPSVDVTTSVAQILPQDLTRKGVIFQNLTDTDIYIGTDPATTVTDGPSSGLKIAANGGVFDLSQLPGSFLAATVPLYAVHGGTGTQSLRYLQL